MRIASLLFAAVAACGSSARPADGGLDGAVDAGGPDGGDLDPAFVHVRFDPDGEGFYRMPWPSDARLTERGTPDLSDFPQRRRILDEVLVEIESSVLGFANMPVVYVALEGRPPDAASLPTGLEALSAESPVQLIDLSEEGCGERFPLEMEIETERDPYLDANVLQIANAIGTILLPRRPYGLVVRRDLGAPEGRSTPRPEAFDRALADVAGSTRLGASLAPLRRCLPDAGLSLDDVAVATVFTPQDPIDETRRMREVAVDPERAPTRAVEGWRVSDGWSRRRLDLTTHVGTVELPIFQDGETPYDDRGGGLVFDEDGAPTIQRWEAVPFSVAQRVFETPPVGPRPVLLFLDGTGWERWTHLPDNWIGEALDAGWVVVSFMPQFHGGRAGFEGSTELSTFNLLNAPAGRTNFRQQAVETSFFVRVLREQVAGLPGLPELDTDHIVYGGHSQGALNGALVAAVEDQIDAYVLNGVSSVLTLTLLHRKDLFDFENLIALAFSFLGTFDRFHPLLQLLEVGAAVVDPASYARLWRGWEGNPSGNHVFVVNGFEDDTTTPRGMDNLMMVGDIPPIETPGWEIDPVGVWEGVPVTMPVAANATSFVGEPLTLATYTDGQTGHGTIYRRQFARDLAIGFWSSAREGVPRLVARAEFMCGDGADGDEDGLVDCVDPDCAERPPCVEGRCDDGVDEDENGLTDCADPRCEGDEACAEETCDDGVDDDGDGSTDCADPDCARTEPCGEGDCDDRIDGDMDGLTDCADPDCAGRAACVERRCTDGLDDDRDGLTDCADPDCADTLHCPEAVCDDGVDDDGNGRTDCGDPGCATAPTCARAREADCADGTDDDGDGATDCEDADCAMHPTCAARTCADGDLGRQVGVALFRGTLAGAGNELPPGDCVPLGRGDEAPEVALSWTAPAAGRYLVSTYGSVDDEGDPVDTTLVVLPPDCDPVTELACNDDEAPVPTSAVTLTLEAGQTVVIVVGASDADEDADPFVLHVLRAD